MKLFKAMATVAGLTGISRIVGFIRDILTAAILGAGPVADAFFVALKLPNLFRRITAEGAFSVSFVPLYAGTLEKSGPQKADAFASNAFTVMLLILSIFIFLAMLVMPYIIYVIAPGFAGDDVRYPLAVELSRITFPYLLLMSLTALLGGVLNAREKFAPFAAAPIIFNLVLIAALLFGAPVMETPGHAMAWGVSLAGVLQFILLLACVKRMKVGLRLVRPRFDSDIKQLFKLMGPGVIGAGVMHINLFADLIIASFLGTGSISYLYYADRLNQLPLGIVGVTVGTALLPLLSKAMAKGNEDEAKNMFNRALEICLLLAVPAAVALAIIPGPIVTVLFERGAFSPADTAVTAAVLTGYAIGVPAYVAGKVFSTSYWARQDTGTPVKISIIATIFNIVLSLLLIRPMGVAGIAIATGLAGWLQFCLLRRGLKGLETARYDDRFKMVAPRIFLSAGLMGIALYMITPFLEDWLHGDLLFQITALVTLVGGGMMIYGLTVTLTGAVKMQDIKKLLARK